MKRAIALNGIPPDVPWDALKAAFMDRRWRMIADRGDGLKMFCTGTRHYLVSGSATVTADDYCTCIYPGWP